MFHLLKSIDGYRLEAICMEFSNISNTPYMIIIIFTKLYRLQDQELSYGPSALVL